MTGRKESIHNFFRCIECCMFTESVDQNMDVNKEYDCFIQETIRILKGRFMVSEDSYRIPWYHFFIQLTRSRAYSNSINHNRDSGTDEEVEITNKPLANVQKDEVFKYEEIRTFFGMLQQCLEIIAKKNNIEEDSDKIQYIGQKIAFLIKMFSNSEDVQSVSWGAMWKHMLNSETYYSIVRMDRTDENVWSESISDYGNDGLMRQLIDIDREREKYSHFICIMTSNYVGFDKHPRGYGTDRMKGKRKKLMSIFKALDKDKAIENMFRRLGEKEGNSVWEISSIDGNDFYQDIKSIDPIKASMDCMTAQYIYNKYFGHDKEEMRNKHVEQEEEQDVYGSDRCMTILNELIKVYEDKGTTENWHVRFLRLGRVAELLCKLLPVVYHSTDGAIRIKPYQQWKNQCETIKRVIREKQMSVGIDWMDVSALELVQEQMKKISNEYEIDKDIQACYKKRYLICLQELNKRFTQSAELVISALDNTHGKENLLKLTTEALDVVYI